MKFALKSLVAAAALAATAMASAAPVTGAVGQAVVVKDPANSGRKAELTLLGTSNGTLEFSNGTSSTSVGGVVGALNVGKVAFTGVDNAQVTIGTRVVGRETVRSDVSVTAKVVSLTADDVTGQVLRVNSFGGAQQVAGYLSGVLDGGRATVKDLSFDLVNKQVLANWTGNALLFDPATNSEYYGPNITGSGAMWTFSNITGPTVIPPSALLAADPAAAMQAAGYTFEGKTGDLYTFSATNVISGLKVTTQGFNFFAAALGLNAGSTGYNTLAAVNNEPDGWGSVTSTLRFTVREVTAVPEPSTYALMGVGLLAVAVATRRRAAK